MNSPNRAYCAVSTILVATALLATACSGRSVTIDDAISPSLAEPDGASIDLPRGGDAADRDSSVVDDSVTGDDVDAGAAPRDASAADAQVVDVATRDVEPRNDADSDIAVCDAAPNGSCGSEAGLTCDGMPNGHVEVRVRYKDATVAFNNVCQSETQQRICDGGKWSTWGGSYSADRCEVAAPKPCGDAANATLQSRIRYEQATVDIRSTCNNEAQTRTCNDGTWSPWSGTFAAESCIVAPPKPCGDVPNATLQSRIRYERTTVDVGGRCNDEAQTRTCNDGTWSPWSGTFAAESCSVAAPKPCGDAPSGTTQARTRFESASVILGQVCKSETQTRACSDGQWSPWSGGFAAEKCEVLPLPCDGVPSGTVENRTRYQRHGRNCAREAQTRTCQNGTWRGWSGTFTELSCSPN